MTVALKNKAPVVVPSSAIRRAGFKRGQELEVKASGGMITIVPKLPNADDEYTPAQRRAIDARLAEAMDGRTYGPFNTADEMIAHMKAGFTKKSSGATKNKRTR